MPPRRYNEREEGSSQETRQRGRSSRRQTLGCSSQRKGGSPRSVHLGGVGVGCGHLWNQPPAGPRAHPPLSRSVSAALPRSSARPPGLGAKGAGPGVRSGKPAGPQVPRRRLAREEPAAAPERGSPTRQARSGGEATTAPRGSRGPRASVRVCTRHPRAVRVHTANPTCARRLLLRARTRRRPTGRAPPGRAGADRGRRWRGSGTLPSSSQSGI